MDGTQVRSRRLLSKKGVSGWAKKVRSATERVESTSLDVSPRFVGQIKTFWEIEKKKRDERIAWRHTEVLCRCVCVFFSWYRANTDCGETQSSGAAIICE